MRVRLDVVSSCLSRLVVIGLTLLCAALILLGMFAAAYFSGLAIQDYALVRVVITVLVAVVPLSAFAFFYRLFDRWIPDLPPFVALESAASASAQARNLERAFRNARSANQRER